MTIDPESVTVMIGGEAVPVPPMSFAQLKRAWPAIRALPTLDDIVAQAAAVVEILAAALARSRPDLTADIIEERMIGAEFVALLAAAPRILEVSGLVAAEAAPPGEAVAAAGSPSIP